jgi:hypothetical protein
MTVTVGVRRLRHPILQRARSQVVFGSRRVPPTTRRTEDLFFTASFPRLVFALDLRVVSVILSQTTWGFHS